MLTKDVSKSCHMRRIRCLRPQIYVGWLEMWRCFILGTLFSLSVGISYIQWCHIIQADTYLQWKDSPAFLSRLSLHFRPSAVSYTFLSLAYVYPSFFRAHTALKEQKFIFICSPSSGRLQQSCWSFLQFFTIKDFIKWKPAAGEKIPLFCISKI